MLGDDEWLNCADVDGLERDVVTKDFVFCVTRRGEEFEL